MGREIFRVLEEGRVAVFVVADVRIDGELYPIVADLIKIMQRGLELYPLRKNKA